MQGMLSWTLPGEIRIFMIQYSTNLDMNFIDNYRGTQ